MKKKYILIFTLFYFFSLNAQTIKSYNFEGGLPSGWTAENAWKIGNIAALKSDYFSYNGNNTKFAGVNDDNLGQTGSGNGKLITDFIDFATYPDVLLSCDLYYFHANYENGGQETFNIYYSENGTTWTLIDAVEERYFWNPYFYAVSAPVGGKKVKFAFEYKDGGNWNFGVGIDNLEFSVQPNFFIKQIPPQKYFFVNSPEEKGIFDFTFLSYGKIPLNKTVMKYSINGQDVLQKETNKTLNANDSYTFEFNDFKTGSFEVISSFIFNDTLKVENDTNIVEVVTPIPALQLKDTDGVSRDLHSELKSGKAVLIDFFASWCDPCKNSTPVINKVWEKYGKGSDKFQIYGLTVESTDDESKVKSLNWGGKYPKFAYSERNELYWNVFYPQFNEDQSIPFFTLICPDTANVGFSEISWSLIGNTPSLETDLTNAVKACVGSPSKVKQLAIENLSIYPNPVTDKIFISFGSKDTQKMRIYITDINGKTVKEISETFINNYVKLSSDISDLKSGTYLLNISSTKGHDSQKFIKL